MAQIVNLRMARKAKARADQASTAQANRAKHGEPLAAKNARKAQDMRAKRDLDGKKREQD